METKTLSHGGAPLPAAELVTSDNTRTETQGHSTPAPVRGQRAVKNGAKLALISILVSLGVTAVGFQWWRHASAFVSTDNAFVAGHVHQVSARIAGTVTEVLAEDHATVIEGAVLARLDRSDLQVKRQQAEARVAESGAELNRALSEGKKAEAQLAEQQAQARKTELDVERARKLFHSASGAISRQELDDAESAFAARKAGVQSAQAAVVSSTALRSAAEAQQRSAQAALAESDLQLSYTEVKAPAQGRIGRKNIEVGNRVQPGQPLLAVVGEDLWVIANFKETQLARLKPGQRVRIRLDAFGRRTFEGRVQSFSPASGAQFSLLPPDNATGNFTRIVQRVPVKIVFSRETLTGLEELPVPGMSAVVEVQVRE